MLAVQLQTTFDGETLFHTGIQRRDEEERH